MSDGPSSNSRRNFLKSSLIAISWVALPGHAVAAAIGNDGAKPHSATQSEPRFLEEPERGFLEAAVDRLLRPDERWPGAAEAGVNYIALQMTRDWGKGNLIYRHGPFRQGSPAQGYQLEYTNWSANCSDRKISGRQTTGRLEIAAAGGANELAE
jgi:gluconate 2-dehydrogenase gamma chain